MQLVGQSQEAVAGSSKENLLKQSGEDTSEVMAKVSKKAWPREDQDEEDFADDTQSIARKRTNAELEAVTVKEKTGADEADQQEGDEASEDPNTCTNHH